jgi:cytochrome c5
MLAMAAVHATAPGYESDVRAYNLAHGRVVFNQHCLRCHEQGREGAPVLSESNDWASRLDQSLDTLIRHAIRGHGDMPARGETELSDQDVAAAVAYVVNRARLLVAEDVEELASNGAGQVEATPSESLDEAVIQMFMLLIGKDRWN